MQSKKLQRELAKVPPELHELYRAVRKMNTFVCEVCHDEELNTHPLLGDEWTTEWYLAMAVLAREQGWVATIPHADRESWFFQDFQIVGPHCQTSNGADHAEPAAAADGGGR